MHIPALSEDMLLNDDTRDGVEEHNSKKVLDFINSIYKDDFSPCR